MNEWCLSQMWDNGVSVKGVRVCEGLSGSVCVCEGVRVCERVCRSRVGL